MSDKEFRSYVKVKVAEFYEMLSENIWNFIDCLNEEKLTDEQADYLSGKLASALKGDTPENEEFICYHCAYITGKMLEMIGGDEE